MDAGNENGERVRLAELMKFEKEAQQLGFQRIAGIDEAGRGPLAGPVVAAACILPEGVFLPGLNDSKKLSATQRSDLFQKIISLPNVDYGLGVMDVGVIDQVNILQATLMAMLAALACLSTPPDFILVDGNFLPQTPIPGRAVVRGDQLSQSIAAASILAKQARDSLMHLSHEQWPEYGFNEHKGYGTKKHLSAIDQYGPCPFHRLSFKPLKSIILNGGCA